MHKSKNEKAKNFKTAITRLIKELNIFKGLIIFAFTLAALSSVLSILSPNKMSSLVDEISYGLIVNKDNLNEISQKITHNMQNVSVENIVNSNKLTNEEKNEFKTKLELLNNSEDILSVYSSFSSNILNLIFIPFQIDKTTITSQDQIEFLSVMKSINKESNVNDIYSRIDILPENIKNVVEPSMNFNAIKRIALFILCLYLLAALFNYLEAISMTKVSNNFAKELRNRISKKINLLPLKYFDKNQKGDILSRVTNDVDMIAQSMNQSFADVVSASTLFIGTIIMMFYTNAIMAITAIISSLFGFLFMAKVLSKSQIYHNQRQQYLGEINGYIEEVYSGLNIVKVYNGKKQVNDNFDIINENLYNANRKGQFLSSLMMPMMGFVGNFGYVAVCIVGALLTFKGTITFGVIVAFITYVRLFTSPLSQIGQCMTSLQSAAAASERVFEFLDEEEMLEEKNKRYLDKKDVIGNIEFENIEFTYDGNTKPTIKNFSAIAKKGQKIAIVGPTGAGKTTMVSLLMKFYEINSGDIKIDGISTKELSRDNIHNLFTMVLQDTWLFEGTIKENIIYNRKNISDEQVKEVCKIVGLDHFIKTLSEGYNSKITDNDSISSGQRQLLTIARGMINTSPFLILDEATSNVDTRTEELVQKAMDKLTEGKTSFIIAHRLSTIKNADLILVMKDGNIIEQGNHNELILKNGFYAELYNSQFEL